MCLLPVFELLPLIPVIFVIQSKTLQKKYYLLFVRYQKTYFLLNISFSNLQNYASFPDNV